MTKKRSVKMPVLSDVVLYITLGTIWNICLCFVYTRRVGEQVWRSGESARLPPMCPGFDSQTRRHMWVEFVVGFLLCSERFFSGYSGFPLSSKTNISKFQFDPGMHGHVRNEFFELLGAP